LRTFRISINVQFTVDGAAVEARSGQSIIQACDEAGIYIPRLCYTADLPPGGQCRLCTCKVNGRYAAACVTPAAPDMIVENETPELLEERRMLIEMLFVEGNHFCPLCERSGDCDLQAMAYRFGLPAMELAYQWPKRELDATHPQIFLDRNTCILCGLCVRASRVADGKTVFGFAERGARTTLIVDSPDGLAGTTIDPTDRAVEVCPVGCIVVKNTGYRTPYGERRFDDRPIGSAQSDARPAQAEPKARNGA
jgi:[NiFe] hydrogenase diaphorase moiety small subunit